MSDREKLTAATVLLVVLIILVWVLGGVLTSIPLVPRCAEDTVVVGQGDFEEGRWSYYICGPALDDFIGR